jgi:small subunit ribosomal protein S16
MLRIRLRRVGAKKQPSYRIVVAESTAPRDGKFAEVIGFYNPRTDPETVTIKEARALHWLSVGAQPSDPVVRLFKNNGTLERFSRLKAGESLEDLVAEKQAETESGADVSPTEISSAPESTDVDEVEDEVEVLEDESVEDAVDSAEEVSEEAEA